MIESSRNESEVKSLTKISLRVTNIPRNSQVRHRESIQNEWKAAFILKFFFFLFFFFFCERGRKWEIGSERHGRCWIGVQRLARQSSEVGQAFIKMYKSWRFPTRLDNLTASGNRTARVNRHKEHWNDWVDHHLPLISQRGSLWKNQTLSILTFFLQFHY